MHLYIAHHIGNFWLKGPSLGRKYYGSRINVFDTGKVIKWNWWSSLEVWGFCWAAAKGRFPLGKTLLQDNCLCCQEIISNMFVFTQMWSKPPFASLILMEELNSFLLKKHMVLENHQSRKNGSFNFKIKLFRIFNIQQLVKYYS